MQQYIDLCTQILNEGEISSTRTGIDTIGIFGAMMKFDLRKGFPILTTKKILWDTVVDELLWFIRGGHNINDGDAPKRIWDDWADKDGELGRIYGVQWRDWKYTEWIRPEDGSMFPSVESPRVRSYDQLTLAIEQIKRFPNSRRNIVSAWNVGELNTKDMIRFPPCHVLFHFRVIGKSERLDMTMYQRSADMALGVPFNISSYALLLSLVANECNLTPGIFTHCLADAHIYVNHVQNLTVQMQRKTFNLPTLRLPVGKKVVDIKKQDIVLENYSHHSFIKYEVAV